MKKAIALINTVLAISLNVLISSENVWSSHSAEEYAKRGVKSYMKLTKLMFR
jgi:hypothetical protein